MRQIARPFAWKPGMDLELQPIDQEHRRRALPHQAEALACMLGRHQAGDGSADEGQQPQKALHPGQLLPAKAECENAHAQHIAEQGNKAEAAAGQRIGPGPLGARQVGAQVQHPAQGHQRKPAIGACAPLQQPDAEEQHTRHRTEHGIDKVDRALAPLLARLYIGYILRRAQAQLAQTGAQRPVADRVDIDGIGAWLQRRFRQQPPARHIPAARQRLDQRGIAPEQIMVHIDGTGHADAINAQRNRRRCHRRLGIEHLRWAFTGAFPGNAVPDGAIVRGPAAGPQIGQRDRLPAVGRCGQGGTKLATLLVPDGGCWAMVGPAPSQNHSASRYAPACSSRGRGFQRRLTQSFPGHALRARPSCATRPRACGKCA